MLFVHTRSFSAPLSLCFVDFRQICLLYILYIGTYMRTHAHAYRSWFLYWYFIEANCYDFQKHWRCNTNRNCYTHGSQYEIRMNISELTKKRRAMVKLLFSLKNALILICIAIAGRYVHVTCHISQPTVRTQTDNASHSFACNIVLSPSIFSRMSSCSSWLVAPFKWKQTT